MTAVIPEELNEFYPKTESKVNDFTRQYWRDHPNGDQAGAEAYVHEQRVAAAAEMKAVQPQVEAFGRSMDRMRTALYCKIDGQLSIGGRDGLCPDCAAAADLLTLLGDEDRLNAVRRYLAQVAASGRQWRGRPITITEEVTRS